MAKAQYQYTIHGDAAFNRRLKAAAAAAGLSVHAWMRQVLTAELDALGQEALAHPRSEPGVGKLEKEKQP